jgi:hypothetical protein
MTDKRYISAADTAKLVRKALASNFPGQLFSVTSKTYSMGASIRVRWTDGPTSSEVDSVVKQFAGADFDPMQDLKEYHDSTHPETGERVHYGADYVFTERSYTRELLEKACKEFEEKWGMTPVEIKHDSTGAYLVEDNRTIRGGQSYQTIKEEIYKMAREMSAYTKPAPKLENLPDAPMISPNSPHRATIDAQTAKPSAKVETFKGHPVIAIPLGNGDEFKFGKAKAKALLQYLKEIEEFAKD